MLPELHLESPTAPLGETSSLPLFVLVSVDVPGFGPPRYNCGPVAKRSQSSVLARFSHALMPTREKAKPCPPREAGCSDTSSLQTAHYGEQGRNVCGSANASRCTWIQV